MKKFVSGLIVGVMVIAISVSAFASPGGHGHWKNRKFKKMSPEIKAKIEEVVKEYNKEVSPLKEELSDLYKDYRSAKKADDDEKAAVLKNEIKALKKELESKNKSLNDSLRSIKATKADKTVKTHKAVKTESKKSDKKVKGLSKEKLNPEVKAQIEEAVEKYKTEITPIKDELKSLYKDLFAAKKADNQEEVTAIKDKIKTLKDEIRVKCEALRTLIKSLLTPKGTSETAA